MQNFERVALIVDEQDSQIAQSKCAADLPEGLLRRIGHEVVVVHDGSAALEVLAVFTPEVALLDLGLPLMDGFELAGRIGVLLPTVRLIAITGYRQEHDRERPRLAGLSRHLTKPVDRTELAQIIGRG